MEDRLAVTPIQARCRRCGEDFHLIEVLDDRSGTCPRCGWSLTLDWTAKLLDDAARADIAQGHLVGALRSLSSLPGNVVLRPHTVLRNLFEEVGWEHDLAQNPEMLRDEIRELRRLLAAWELLDPLVVAAQPHRNWVRRVVDWLTGRPVAPVVPVAVERAGPDSGGIGSEGADDRGSEDREVEYVVVGS
jgi:hypothetical protein